MKRGQYEATKGQDGRTYPEIWKPCSDEGISERNRATGQVRYTCIEWIVKCMYKRYRKVKILY